MNWVGLFYFSFCWMACNVQGAQQKEVEENHWINIPYVTTAEAPQNKWWYRGDISSVPNPDDPLFTRFAGDSKWSPGAGDHDGMSADLGNDSLTINNVHLKDNGFFTCRTSDSATRTHIFDRAVELNVYIQPTQPTVTTVPAISNLEACVNLEVTCTIERLYPDITQDAFTMTWGGETVCPNDGDAKCKFELNKNTDPDLASKVTLQWTKNLTVEDNGAEVNCTITPVYGKAVTSEPLNLDVASCPTPPHRGLTGGAIAGIVIGSVAGVVLISVGVYFGILHNKKGGDGKVAVKTDTGKGVSGGKGASEGKGEDVEANSKKKKAESGEDGSEEEKETIEIS